MGGYSNRPLISSLNDVPLPGEDIRAALDVVVGGEPAAEEQRPHIGCNIKLTGKTHEKSRDN